MSIYSDYKCGALSESDYRWLSARESRKERYIDEWERLAEESEDYYDYEDGYFGDSYKDGDYDT